MLYILARGGVSSAVVEAVVGAAFIALGGALLDLSGLDLPRFHGCYDEVKSIGCAVRTSLSRDLSGSPTQSQCHL